MSDSMRSFLEAIRSTLSVGPRRAGRIARELEDHLESSAAMLRHRAERRKKRSVRPIIVIGLLLVLQGGLNAVNLFNHAVFDSGVV